MEPIVKEKLPKICASRDILLQAAMIRLGNIDKEIEDGYNILRKYHKTVTIFGSARTPMNSLYYEKAVEVSEKLAGHGYAIVSGGGYGIMSAANEGAHIAVQNGARKAGGESIAFNIKLPHEQHLNPYATESYEFQHFAPRKIVMTLYADAYIYFPGGYGTIDELTEILTLIQTGKTNKAPIILVGSSFWEHFDEFVREAMLQEGTISEGDEELYTITDSVNEIVKLVTKNKQYCTH
ncbi:TIGR00730 family Rossman fold protein [Candidatus Saccharibacteria bacterium]|nr:TIGR00730 family Rossman fold protein [Candidatus Saccharibacteria bacterium]